MYYTFIMLKPDALDRQLVGAIMEYFYERDMQIERFDCRVMTEALIDDHYKDAIKEYGNDFKSNLIPYLYGQYVIPVVLKSNSNTIISDVRAIIGKTDPSKAEKGTVRGDLGIDSFEKCSREDRSCENLIHASDSEESLKRELKIWFGRKVAKKYI